MAKRLSASRLRQALEGDRKPSDPLQERRLVAAARRGDRRALDQLARRISGSLYRFSRGFCRNPHDAEDVMQDVLAALVSSFSRFRGQASVSSWAYVVARHACARRRKRAARYQSLEDGGGRALQLSDPRSAPERGVERRELREALESFVAALPETLRDVLVLRDVEGLSAAQVARQLGLGERAVKSRLHRARVALREMLAPYVSPEGPPPGPGCPHIGKMLSRFLEGDLDARTCARLEAHVSGCESCGAACASLRSAVRACVAWRDAPVPEELQRAVRAALASVIREVRVQAAP